MSNGETTSPTQDATPPEESAPARPATEAVAQPHVVDDDADNVGNRLAPGERSPHAPEPEPEAGEEPGDDIGNSIHGPAPDAHLRMPDGARGQGQGKRKRNRGEGPRPEGGAPAQEGQGGQGHKGHKGQHHAAEQHRAFKVGDKVRAKVVAVGPAGVMCDLWGKEKGVLDLRELTAVEGGAEPQVGDAVDVIVLQDGSRGGGNLVVTRDPHRAERGIEMVTSAFGAGDAVEALVTGFNRGGLEVDIAGVRGFCPSSQIDVHMPSQADLQALVLRREMFKITALDNGREAVVSRRALREADLRERAQEAIGRIKVGERVKGRVVSVRDHGIFVDLGGVEGRIQLTELSHDRGARPQDVAKVGDEIEALVLRIDVPQAQPEKPAEEAAPAEAAPAEAAPAEGAAEGEASTEGAAKPEKGEKGDRRKKPQHRFSRVPDGIPRVELSRRAVEHDPWSDVNKRYPPGSVHKGKVARMQPFGAFIELEKGVDGLLHVSEIDHDGKRVQHPNEALKEAQEVTVRVAKVDRGQRRIALSLLPEGVTEEQLKQSINPRPGMVVMAKIAEHESYGIWAQIEGTFGKVGRGFIAPPDSAQPRGADLKKVLPVGTDVKVKIVEIDRGRLKLSIRAALQDEERQAYRAYQQQANATTVGVSLADKLRKLNLGSR
ncbi:MAG: S1 RNA-binding domain-containing protein [Polyangiales bacterium]